MKDTDYVRKVVTIEGCVLYIDALEEENDKLKEENEKLKEEIMSLSLEFDEYRNKEQNDN